MRRETPVAGGPPRRSAGAAPPTPAAPTFDFAAVRPPRRPSLTPLVDVVFLLLVFFMLAARFGPERALPLAAAGTGADEWEGPPRLVTVGQGGVALNGVPVSLDGLAEALALLMPTPDAPVVLRPAAGADVQAMVDVLAALAAAGHANLVVLE
jgi:biopolymer transport protein ExbD